MEVIIEQVVSQVRALDSELSPRTLKRVVAAVLEAMRAQAEHSDRVAEEGSSLSFEERNRPWAR